MRGRSWTVAAVIFFGGISRGKIRLMSGTLACQLFTRSARQSFCSHGAQRYGKRSALNQLFGTTRPRTKPRTPVAAR